jgi:hypothetical protein
MRILLILVVCMLASATCAAADVRLHLQRDPRPWDGYPESIGLPMASWADGALHVRYVANETSSALASDRKPTALVDGYALILCYNTEPVVFPAGQPLPSWTGPVLLEFVVTRIPQVDYSIIVRKNCLGAAG